MAHPTVTDPPMSWLPPSFLPYWTFLADVLGVHLSLLMPDQILDRSSKTVSKGPLDSVRAHDAFILMSDLRFFELTPISDTRQEASSGNRLVRKTGTPAIRGVS